MSIADMLRAAGRNVVEIDSTKDAAMVEDEVLRVQQMQERPPAAKPITDVDCAHGSRWIWTPSLNRWFNVVRASRCDCGDPPHDWPESDPEAMRAALRAAGRLPEESK